MSKKQYLFGGESKSGLRVGALMRNATMSIVGAAVGLAGCVSSDLAPAVEPLSPGEAHYGHTHEELASEWWAWLYGLPQANHPVLDETGEDCAVGQPDDVFFLAGTYGRTVHRTCTVPADRPIFFPVVNMSVDNGGVPEEEHVSEAELIEYARVAMDEMDDMTLEIDGRTYDREALAEMRVASRGSYDVPDVHPNMYDRWEVVFSGHVDPSFSDGFWVFLPPLPPGAHHIAFSASDARDPSTMDDDWRLDVEYDLTVE